MKCFNCPFMGFDDIAADRQAEPGTTGGSVTRPLHTIEAIKQLATFFLANPRSAVPDINRHPTPVRLQRYLKDTTAIGIFLRIIQQIIKQLRQAFAEGQIETQYGTDKKI